MSSKEMIERKNEILKKKITEMILQENREGLTSQDSHLKQHFIKELHHNAHSLK